MGLSGRGQCSFSLERQNPDTSNDDHSDDDDDDDDDDNGNGYTDHPDGPQMEGKDDHDCSVPVAEGGKNLRNLCLLYSDRVKQKL